ncbi:uncharacterized protein LOC119421226 [Nematolebias whitei]|uniref:uncharacterized protein LOC119421226 n=1 Tax=Nematolebias whitei TaxID=451745 RepID=UPI001898D527|nr:uncharacterized protein LOC119421226 [Nematolebias whitei]
MNLLWFFLFSAGDGWCTSPLKVVLLGGRNSGKNSVGNLILGKEEFVTRERTSCSRRLGVVDGRWLTVVDAPGWWCDFSAQDTSRLVRREILTSVSLCSPGPHVFLITVKASSAFSERRRRAVEEHVSLLGHDVWRHCIVVFTFAGRSEHTEAQQVLERGGEGLRWLTERCGRRFVVLNGGADGTELLLKIQKLITENGNGAFEVRDSILQAAAEEKRRVDERAQMRFMRMKRHRCLMREMLRPVTDIRIVLLGAKGSGKTSALNTILGRRSSQELRRTAQSCVGDGVVFGRQLTVVDTPGWWMNYFCDETSVFDRREIALSSSLCPPGPHVFLLVIRVDRAFTETHRRAAQEHLELISEHIWSRVVLLFSFGDWLGGTTTEQYLETEGEPLLWLVEKCSNRYHVLNNKTKGDGFQVRELIGKIEEMMSGCSGCWHYEIERKALEELKTRMKTEADRARERLMKKEEQRRTARSELEKLRPLQEFTVILAGGRKAGKSSSGNTILTRESFDTDAGTSSCSEHRQNISEKTVSVVDTPGCFPVTSDLLTTPSALLLVVNLSSSFTHLHREAIEKQLEAEGGQLWSRAMVLFTHGDWMGDTSIERRIESEGAPLQRLVERCGNRYHVLDNKNWGDGAQVRKLLELVEEMLVGPRLAALQRGHRMWNWVSSAEKHSGATRRETTLNQRTSSRLAEAASSYPSLTGAGGSDAAQVVALPSGGSGRQTGFMFFDRDILTSFIVSVLKHGLRRPTVDLPVRFSGSYSLLSLSDSYMSSPRHPTDMSSEGDGISVHALSHPALTEQTLRRMSESGSLQAQIDRSSLDELEAFIDSYFEMTWEQTTGSFQSPEPDCLVAEQDALVRESEGEEVLSSIDRKLSKLELLEEIRADLAELRQNLESHTRTQRQK